MRADATPITHPYQALLKQAAETCSRKEAISLINAATRIRERHQIRALERLSVSGQKTGAHHNKLPSQKLDYYS
jgi:hypothetical protein